VAVIAVMISKAKSADWIFLFMVIFFSTTIGHPKWVKGCKETKSFQKITILGSAFANNFQENPQDHSQRKPFFYSEQLSLFDKWSIGAYLLLTVVVVMSYDRIQASYAHMMILTYALMLQMFAYFLFIWQFAQFQMLPGMVRIFDYTSGNVLCDERRSKTAIRIW
jgi:hypothetical protein